MNCSATSRALRECAGLLVGAGIWAINTQLGEIWPYFDCRAEVRWSAIASFTAASMVVLAGCVSWQSVLDRTNPSFRFLGSVSGLAALLFAFALAMQGAASLVLSGCER